MKEQDKKMILPKLDDLFTSQEHYSFGKLAFFFCKCYNCHDNVSL